jgi:hypothetical protein
MYTNQAHSGPDGGDSHAQESTLRRPIDELMDEYLMDEWQIEKTIQCVGCQDIRRPNDTSRRVVDT